MSKWETCLQCQAMWICPCNRQEALGRCELTLEVHWVHQEARWSWLELTLSGNCEGLAEHSVRVLGWQSSRTSKAASPRCRWWLESATRVASPCFPEWTSCLAWSLERQIPWRHFGTESLDREARWIFVEISCDSWVKDYDPGSGSTCWWVVWLHHWQRCFASRCFQASLFPCGFGKRFLCGKVGCWFMYFTSKYLGWSS